MLKLFSFPPINTALSGSPFAYKAEALLTLAGVPFEKEFVADFSQMPLGKVPVLQDKGQMIADSSLIQKHLTEHYGLAIDKHLTADQQAIAQAFRTMLEERTYWAGVYNRFIDPAGKDFLFDVMFAGVPETMRLEVIATMQQGVAAQLHAHGLGRHSATQIYAFAQADVLAVLHYLGDKPFFFGEQPTSIDATIAGLFANWLAIDFASEWQDFIQSQPKIATYVAQFEQLVFGE